MDNRPAHLTEKMERLLSQEAWKGEYKIVEIRDHDIKVSFMLEEDAKKFETILQQYGAITSLHPCH